MTKELFRRDIMEILADLPKVCAARKPDDNTPIIIRRGEPGYHPAPRQDFDVDGFNSRHNVTAAQVEAMLAGSMFGFHVPGADPLNY
jgi:hypothetical protein